VITGPGCQKTNHATAYGSKLAGNFVVSLTSVFQNKGLNWRGPRRISNYNTNDRYCDAVLAVAAPRVSSFIPVLLSECSDRSAPMMHLVTLSPDCA
jgi:hypothetical protein